MMPRLIDDRRRNRRMVACVLFVAFTAAVLAGGVWIRTINEQWRQEGLSLARDLGHLSAFLSNEMDPCRDAEGLVVAMNGLSSCLATQDSVTLSDVGFVFRTRTVESQPEARKVAKRCEDLVAELSDSRRQAFSLLSDGTNVLCRLGDCAALDAVREIDSARKAISGGIQVLQSRCSGKCVLAFDYKSILTDQRACLSRIRASVRDDEGWHAVEQVHSAYIGCTNGLARTVTACAAAQGSLRDAYRTLLQFPFDSANAAKFTQRIMSDEIRRADSVLSAGADLIGNSGRRADDMLAQYRALARNHYDDLLELQKKHGDFVATSSVTSAWQHVESFETLEAMTQKAISARIETMRESVVRVSAGRKGAEQMLLSLEKGADENELQDVCMKGQALNRALIENDIALNAQVEALTNYIAGIQSEALDKVRKVEEVKSSVERSLPDWRIEGRKIISELDLNRRSVATIRSRAESLRKSFVTCRDNCGHKTIATLHERLDKVFEMLKIIEDSCTGLSPCSTGVEMRSLIQRRDKVKRIVDLVDRNVGDIFQEMERAMKEGTLQKIKFVTSARSFAEQLQQGIRHFDLALDVPRGGHHQVEIRFAKGRNSLYKMSPHKDHKIALQCVVSGTVDRKSELSWNDSPKDWQGGITLDGDFSTGINDINLDLTFSAQDSQNEALYSGTWQYRYEEGWFKKDMRDNFWVEFWLDGIRKAILWGEPET